jgi:hypothetical protein
MYSSAHLLLSPCVATGRTYWHQLLAVSQHIITMLFHAITELDKLLVNRSPASAIKVNYVEEPVGYERFPE